MKRLLVSLGVFLGVTLGFVAWWKISLWPVNTTSSSAQAVFVVTKGDGVREISNKLKDDGLIRDQVAFFLLIKRLGIEKNIQAGSFKLNPSMPAHVIAQKLTVGTEDIWITIPEGWRSEQILEYLQKTGDWAVDEGKYFPETYLIPKQMALEDIRRLMIKTFNQKVPKITSEQLIVASLVEREAKNNVDRPLIASVIYNRLKIGMKLDIDATVQYALGVPGNWWKKDLTLEDLKIKSLYNTYTNAGLPPGPICNPGLATIEAAVNPAKTDYLYYVADKTGTSHFASTFEQHNANIAKYLQ